MPRAAVFQSAVIKCIEGDGNYLYNGEVGVHQCSGVVSVWLKGSFEL